MEPRRFIATSLCWIVLVSAWASEVAAQSDGPNQRRADEPADQSSLRSQDGPVLNPPGGEPARRRAEKPALPVPPAPTPDPDENEKVAPRAADRAPDRADDRRQRAVEFGLLAQKLIGQGRYERAVQVANVAIAQDPDNAAYRRIRAEANQLLGRYEEALADRSPLPATVAPPGARLWSGNDLVATVPAGTRVRIEEVRGNWLKVASADDRAFDWAWIHRGGLSPAGRPRTAARFDRDRYAARLVDPGRGFYDDRDYHPPGYGRPYDLDIYINGRRFHFGREHYDWWRHVPPRYWRYLPR